MKKVSMGISMSVLASAVLLWSGCGSSGDDTAVAPVVPAPVTGTAFYVDSAVEGVTATCGSTVTVTDASGSFAYEEGASCKFTFGDIVLREQAGITEGQFILEDVLRVAQFLQSLDNDNNPSNGITLTPEVLAQMTTDGVVTLPDSDEALAELVTKLQQANIGYGGDFVSGPQAQAHIDATKKALDGTAGDAPAEGTSGTNQPPVAVAGDDFTVEPGTTIELDGGKSTDPDGTITSYSWAEKTNQGNPRNAVIGAFGGLSEGKHTFILTVTDDKGATATDEVVVTIESSIPKSVLEAFGGKTLYQVRTGMDNSTYFSKYTYNADATSRTRIDSDDGFTLEEEVQLEGNDEYIIDPNGWTPMKYKITKYEKECFEVAYYTYSGSGATFEYTGELSSWATYCYSEEEAKKHKTTY